MSLHAFYLEAAKWRDKPLLEGQEVAHMHVLRLKNGDSIRLLDGEGRAALCRIDRLDRKSALLDIREFETFPAPSSRAILALALSKAVRRNFFMEKASELGAWGIWLWQADRSQGKLAQPVIDACRMQLVSGMKQCRNPWLPRLQLAKGVEGVCSMAESARQKFLPWEEAAGTAPISSSQLGLAGDSVYVIGPEGGFSDREVNLLKNSGFQPVSLGNRLLRCETAALLCLGLHWWAAQRKELEKP